MSKQWTIRMIMIEPDDPDLPPVTAQSVNECASDALSGLGLEPYMVIAGNNTGDTQQLLLVDDVPVKLGDLVSAWRHVQSQEKFAEEVIRSIGEEES